MLEDEHGAELLYYLAKHPKELERIAQLSPASAVMAIGKLSVSLSPASPENGKPKITGAPAAAAKWKTRQDRIRFSR